MQWFNCPFAKFTNYMVFTIRRPSGHLSCIIHMQLQVFISLFFMPFFSENQNALSTTVHSVYTCLVSSSLLSNLEHMSRYLEKHRCHHCSRQSCTQLHEMYSSLLVNLEHFSRESSTIPYELTLALPPNISVTRTALSHTHIRSVVTLPAISYGM